MIQAHNICLSFGNQDIFDHISFIINQQDRIGLVGRNGSGKTTLLKAIIDPSVLDDGAITLLSKKRIAYMPQEVVLQSSLSILDETFTTFSELHALLEEIKILEKKLELEPDAKTIDRYAHIREELAEFLPELLRAKTKKILMGLGFSLQQLEQPVSSLSVGWKMRIVLAKLLLQEADFYLFDEPTNHLDLMAKEWFLSFLKQADFGFILICHEKYFLDELCDKILELELGKATWYTGNYSTYIVQKEHNLELLETAYIQQQKEIKQKRATIERFRASATKSRMALSMEKSLEKIELIELPPSPKNVQFSFPPVQQAGKVVLTVHNVSQKFGDKIIFKNISCEIKRGQKVALIAPNGVGKTTLFNIITGALPCQHGSITLGHNVTTAIFAQDQNKVLNSQLSILDNIKEHCPNVSEQKIRSFLGAFLFSNEDVFKKVAVLSGGEKNRVGMISVLLQQANLLLLDEPTNHLDIPSKEILLKALQEFNGTLLFVSHDRDFINNLATDIIELTPNGAYHYAGNYDAYVYHKNAILQESGKGDATKITREQPVKTASKESHELRQTIKKVEEKITKLESQIEKVNLSFADLTYRTPEFTAAQTKLQQLQKEVKDSETQWEELQSQFYK